MTDPKKNKVDWITPPDDVSRIVVPVLGGMPDVDPCAHPSSFIKPKVSFFGHSDEDDGFRACWHEHGNTAYVCPTFGNTPPKATRDATLEEVCPHPMVFHRLAEWVAKAALMGQRMTVLALLPNYVDRNWFHSHVVESTAFCLLERRRQFHLPDANGGTFAVTQPQDGHQYVLWTPDGGGRAVEAFCDALADDGLIVEPG